MADTGAAGPLPPAARNGADAGDVAGTTLSSLPRDYPPTRSAAARIGATRRLLDAGTLRAADRFGAEHGHSRDALLLAVFALLLQRLGREHDVTIDIGIAQAAGASVVAVPLRLHVDPEASFADLLLHARSQEAKARAGAASVPPAAPPVAGDGSRAIFGDPAPGAGHAGLRLWAAADQGQTLLHCLYDADSFASTSIDRWLESFETLLGAVVAAPDRPVSHASMASPGQLQALQALQPAPKPRVRGQRIPDLLARVAAGTRSRAAIVHQGTIWTGADLDRVRHQIAHRMRSAGVGRGDLVGLCLDRHPTMVAALLAVLDTGAGYVPLDPAYPRDRLGYMAHDAGIRLLVVEAATRDSIDWPEQDTLLLDPAISDDTDPGPLPEDERAADAESPAYVIYTSGSTGQPKGVSVPHRAVVNFLLAMQDTPGLGVDDRVLAITTLSFDIAVLELLLPLATGATIVLASREQAMDGRALAALVQTQQVTVMQATPSSWRMLLDTGWRPPHGFRALCGGEALPAALVDQLGTGQAQLWNMYGPTETTVWSTCERVAPGAPWISIGTPIDNTTVWILDPHRNPCPIGVPGEIWIGGSGVALGYLHRPELTGERFIDDPFSPEGRLYATGDLGRWRDGGKLEHLGRLDHQVKVRGHRIELGEIEARLSLHPGIRRAVVVTREDRPGDVRIVAYVVTEGATQLDTKALRQFLRAALPEYMLPQHVVALADIPLLPNGKVDRKSLPSPAQQHATAGAGAGVAPRNDTERRIASIFSTLLGQPAIGIHDGFFALGGHSLLAAHAIARINRDFGLDLPVRTIFDAPDVASLAEAVSRAPACIEEVPALGATADGFHPLTVMQERIWIHGQLHPGSVAYNIPVAWRLQGELDIRALSGALEDIVRQQSTLRLRIEHGTAGAVQTVVDAVPLLLPLTDLSALPAPEREQALSRRIAALSRRSIDSSHPGAHVAELVRMDEHHHVLFLMFHHVFWDGGSTTLLSQALAVSYPAMLAQAPAPRGEPPVHYGDYAAWHRLRLSRPDHQSRRRQRIDTWTRWLHTHGAPVALPGDLAPPSGAAPAARAGTPRELVLASGLTASVRSLAAAHDTTAYVVLLAACHLLLHHMGGGDHPLTGSPVRLPGHPDLASTMGMFTHLAPVSLQIDHDHSFSSLLAQARSMFLDGLDGIEVQLDDILRQPELRPFATRASPYQAQVSFEDVRDRPDRWGQLAAEALPVLPAEVTEDLMLWWFDHGDRLSLQLLYDGQRFRAETIQRFLDGHVHLLAAAAASPASPLGTLLAGLGPAGQAPPDAPDAPVASSAAGPYAAPGTDPQPAPARDDRHLPATDAERLVARIWAELLETGDIDVRDTFFDLGGHSMLAMAMIERIERATGTRLSLLTVANASLRGIAKALPDAPAAAPAQARRGLLERVRGFLRGGDGSDQG